MTRTYDMAKRAAGADRTSARIAEHTENLLSTMPIGDVTLQAIAAGSGVSIQTVLRHMGSREGCFAAVGERVSTRIQAQLGNSTSGNVGAAISDLCAHYEAEGRLVLNLLQQEHGGEPIAHQAATAGRIFHRDWVERCFAPLVSEPDEATVDALVVVTDLYVWKLLRLDLGRSAESTRSIITNMVRAQLEAQ